MKTVQRALIVDYICGELVEATPEEVQAVQVFAKRLHEDYDYPKAHIRTRPQFRVRARPSDQTPSYPTDITVFNSANHIEEELFIVVECKKTSRKDGIAQLHIYLDMSPAQIGVWFNGEDHAYFRKILHPNGTRTYQEIPNIPRYGQRIEDVGLYKRADLKKPSNLKAVFRDLRNHLAGTTTGITRDEALAQEIINLLFCKILDEHETAPDETVQFRAGVGESSIDIQMRILDLFNRVKSAVYGDVFDPQDTIDLDPESLCYVVGELQNYCVTEADRDAVGDAFEVFIGPALRGSEGQFFTPRNVVDMVIGMLDPKPGERIGDPSCGSGGFLIASLAYVWAKLAELAVRNRWSEAELARRRIEVSQHCFRGIDKDGFLAKVCKAYMALMGDGRTGVYCDNSLLPANEWRPDTRQGITHGFFDVIVTNPPFGAKIKIEDRHILAQYDLGHQWRKGASGELEKQSAVVDHRPPQILFLERCLQLLKDGGRMGIVLPESVMGSPSYEYVVQYLLQHTTLLAVITMPEALFKTSGKGGTHCKVCVVLLRKERPSNPTKHQVFMAEAKWCGHDSRSNPTIRIENGHEVLLDDVPTIGAKWRRLQQTGSIERDHLGFLLRLSDIHGNVLIPKYYDPEIDAALDDLEPTHNLIEIQDLLDQQAISVTTGTEVGKMAYGTGTIPFVRTSDLSNWEIKADFKHGVSEDIYLAEKRKCDVQAGDILMVRDGTYLIGTTAMVTESDVPMLFQSHVLRIRVLKPEVIDPWLLFVALNSRIVKRQIRARQFTQDIIDTLGNRLCELVLPIPKDGDWCRRMAEEAKTVVETRIQLRNRARELAWEIEGIEPPSEEEELEDLEGI